VRASRYEQESPWVRDPAVSGECLSLLDKTRFGSILDAGGGTGALSAFLAETASVGKVTIVDSSRAMLQRAPRHFEIICRDLCEIHSLERSFETILVRQVLHYLSEPEKVWSALMKRCAARGQIYVGQIVAPTLVSANWVDGVAHSISPNRKQVFTIDSILNLLFCSEGLRLSSIRLLPFRDSVSSWARRSPYPDIERVLAGARTSLTDRQATSLHIDRADPELGFELLWLHSCWHTT